MKCNLGRKAARKPNIRLAVAPSLAEILTAAGQTLSRQQRRLLSRKSEQARRARERDARKTARFVAHAAEIASNSPSAGQGNRVKAVRLGFPRSMTGSGRPPATCARHGTDLGGASPLRADWPEPLANGNRVAARWGGEEAGGTPRS